MVASEAMKQFHGCYVATLTPFDESDRVDEGVVRAHTRWLIESGIEGICPAGTTGEFLFLTMEEKQRLISATVDAAGGKVPVIACVWGLRQAEILHLTRAAQDSGAAAVFLPPPIYYPANDEAIYQYYSSVRNATDLPVFAYNIPQYAANEISIECLQRLFDAGVIVGAKDSSGKSERMSELVKRFGEIGLILAASDSFASEGRRLGADGFISAIANAAPELFARLWHGEDELQSEVDKIRTVLKRVGSIPALKHLATRLGFPFGESRIPYSALTPSQIAVLDTLEV